MKKKFVKILAVMMVCALICGIFPQTGVFAADVKLSAKKKTIQVGESFTLTLKNASGKITWKSSDKKVATVKKGVVTGISEGKAKIVAKNAGKKYTCKVTVKNVEIVSDKAEIRNLGIKADMVMISGVSDNASVMINYDSWEECEQFLVDPDGNILLHEKFSDPVDSGLTTKYIDPFEGGYCTMDNGLTLSYYRGYYKSNGKKAFKIDWQENAAVLNTTEFKGGIAVVRLGETAESGIYDYLINKKGKVLAKVRVDVDPEKDIEEWLEPAEDGMSAYMRREGEEYELLGYYNNKGKLIEAKDENGNNYKYGWYFEYGVAAVLNGETDLYGFINKKGELVLPCEYSKFVDGFYNGYAVLAKTIDGEKRTGVIDREGNVIIPFEYYERGYTCAYDFGIIRMFKDNKGGAVNLKGEVVIPFVYEDVYCMAENCYIAINSDRKYGLIDAQNNVIVPFEYDGDELCLENMTHGVVSWGKDGKFGCISSTGEIVAPFVFDDISDFSANGIAYAVKDGELYCIKLK